MWKENPAVERTRPIAMTKSLTEDEFRSILDRLESIQHVIRDNEELRELLSQSEAETKELRVRNTEMEDMLKKFGPILVEAGTAMGLVGRNEKP